MIVSLIMQLIMSCLVFQCAGEPAADARTAGELAKVNAAGAASAKAETAQADAASTAGSATPEASVTVPAAELADVSAAGESAEVSNAGELHLSNNEPNN